MFIYLFYINREDLILYGILLIAVYVINIYKFDFIPVGIVESREYNYFVVDKILYKVKVNTDNLKLGDILYFDERYTSTDNLSYLKKNILYEGNSYNQLFNIWIRNAIENRINSFKEDTVNILNSIFYHHYSYDDVSYNLGYGLYSYYFLNMIKKKSKPFCIAMMIILSILFTFEIKYILLLIDCIFESKDRKTRFSFKIMVICILNYQLINSYSLLLPLLFSLIGIIDTSLDFKAYLMIIESLCFYEINLLETFFFNKLIRIKIFIYIFSLFLLLIPSIEEIYLFIINICSYFNGLNFSIRGKISILSLLIFIILYKKFNLNRYIQIFVISLLILSPLNNPFMNVCFIDVGQGDSALIKYPLSKSSILIDTGSEYNYYKLKKTLYEKGIYSIDYLIISHDDTDHNGNIDNLMNDFNIRNVVAKGEDISLKNLDFTYFDLGINDNDNDNSLVYMVNIDGYDFLFTGDISKKIENKLIRDYGPLNVDFLKVSHHGSRTGTSSFMIGNTLPQYAIISTSGMYNHPHFETLDTLDNYLVKYYITRDCGNVDIYFSNILDFIKTGNNDFVIINKK